MDVDPQHMIDNIRKLQAEYQLPWRYRVTLAWCVAKLMKEIKDANARNN